MKNRHREIVSDKYLCYVSSEFPDSTASLFFPLQHEFTYVGKYKMNKLTRFCHAIDI